MKQTILLLTVVLFLTSCEKKEDFTTSYTALKFTEKTEANNDFKYVYTLLKYNNSWYSRRLPDNTKKSFTEVLKITVYSNSEKPMNQWVEYTEWMKHPEIMNFKNQAIDSIKQGYQIIEVTKTELYQL